MSQKNLTTAQGAPVSHDEDSLSVGPRGPLALQDSYLIEKLAHFNRERIPERVVHARGSGAYGIFTLKQSLKEYTCASFLQNAGDKTDLFLRFSTVGGEQGSSDMVRDPRGFAVKFYTKQGNYDVVGNNTPVFFLRDPIKFPDFVHTQKRCPVRNINNPNAVWDFWAQNPQSLHQVTILMSDRGIPKSWRHMNGYGSHTFAMWNEKGERFWFKWHFKTQQGIECLTNEEAAEVAGKSPWAAQEDLFDNIKAGNFPKWIAFVQIMPEKQAESYPNAFDLTKVWPHSDYPLIEVGELELNRNPEDYFAEVEQSAFSPSNFVPGIGPSPDRMLQARLFAYPDAHRYRLGVNHSILDVNRSKAAPVSNYQRDGVMCPIKTGQKNYGTYDNASFDDNAHPSASPSCSEPPLSISATTLGRFDHRTETDDYTQAGNLFRMMPNEQKERMGVTIAASLSQTHSHIQEKMLGHFAKADPEYAAIIKKNMP